MLTSVCVCIINVTGIHLVVFEIINERGACRAERISTQFKEFLGVTFEFLLVN